MFPADLVRRALSSGVALALLLFLLGLPGPALASEAGSEAASDRPAAEKDQPAAEPESSVTRHSVTIDGETIEYTATVGWLILEEKGEPVARFGYTAYTRDGVEDPGRRPVLFAFNGGPGSSSIWLHMGVLGPRRVVATDAEHTPPPPARYVENEYSVLDVTDIVMIDPVGTGFSRPLGEAKGEDFWGVDQDVASVASFIKQYVSANGRWASPKYVLGESYGGIRAAGLAWHLQSRHGMNLNGVVLVSPFLDMGSGMDGAGIDLPHVLYLPTLAATAWYHDELQFDDPAEKPGLEEFTAEVERFAYDEYAPALLAGYTLDAERKRAVAEKLAAYTGTTADYWLRADLRVSHGQFLQELQRGDRVITGRIDSRFTGPSVNPLAERMDYDPFFPAVGPAYTAAFLDYLHGELDFGRDEEYRVSASGLDWDWSHTPPTNPGAWKLPWASLRGDLAMAMTHNPGLHLLVQQGYYDLATPLLATKHDIEHLDVTPETRERIRLELYEAGHMMYLHRPSLAKFRQDLASFVRQTDRVD